MSAHDSESIEARESIKAREHATWTASAPGWRRHDDLVTHGTASATELLLELAEVTAGTRLLDLASGTGEPALTAARRIGSEGYVLGSDLTEDMLAFAREKAQRHGLSNVEFRVCDAEQLEVEEGTFDAVTCRWGIMFMPDPVGALRRARAALRPGGRLAVATWAEPERVPFASLPLGVIRQHVDVPTPPPGAPGIFAFADPERLRSALQDAGFAEVTVDEVDVPMLEVDSGAAYWEVMRELAGPITALLRSLPEDTRRAVEAAIAEAADRLRDGDTLRIGGVSWVAGGRKAG